MTAPNTQTTYLTKMLPDMNIDGAVGPMAKFPVVVTAVTDGAATLTAAQLIGGLFTTTTTAARAWTLDTYANVSANLAGYQALTANNAPANGVAFQFTILNTAANNVTLTASAGWTLTGVMTVSAASGTFLAVMGTGAGNAAGNIYRM